MLSRWNTIVEDLNLFVEQIRGIAKRLKGKLQRTKGRPPKQNIEDYLTLIVTKEFDKKSLRATEMRLSEQVCGKRVDHSVIAYWESKPEVTEILVEIVNLAGAMLEKQLGYSFSMIDGTKFSDWFNDETEFHVVNRIVDGVVYPRGMSFITDTVSAPTREATPNGKGKFYGDAWYDDNKTIGVIFTKGYEAIICPNKNRWRGYWRKKSRRLYKLRENRLGYRQRGRGESPFGTLTNYHGKRFKTLNKQVIKTRIAARVIVYQIRLLIRLNIVFVLIIRHAPKNSLIFQLKP